MTAEISAEEKRLALQAVLETRTFSRSAQLKDFLRFVCETEIAGKSSELTEYVIAVEVFHRPADYSSAEDSSVRTRAYELRQKLDKVYKVDLPQAPVHVELPKGSYVPLFRRSAVSLPPGLAVVASPPVLTAPETPFRGIWIAAAALAGAILGAWVFGRVHATHPDPVIAEAWGAMLKPGANVLLCVATPLHLMIGPETHAVPDSAIYPAPAEAYGAFRQHRPLRASERLGMTITDTSVAVGTLNAVAACTKLLTSFGQNFQILPERIATLSTLGQRNTLLFGTPVDSEAITKLLEPAPLIIDYDPQAKEFAVVNRDPKNGLPRLLAPRKDESGAFTDVYGIITVLHGNPSEGVPMNILFTGITSVGTHAAAEFFASAHHVRALKAAFERDHIKGFPASYQVVVSSTVNRLSLLHFGYFEHVVLVR